MSSFLLLLMFFMCLLVQAACEQKTDEEHNVRRSVRPKRSVVEEPDQHFAGTESEASIHASLQLILILPSLRPLFLLYI